MNDDDTRPDPDELLSRITAEEKRTQESKSERGKLKIFFGACAGVGKTYAMLAAGKQALEDGRDVMIGLVETHGRIATTGMVEGLPLIPPRDVDYRGTVIKEFDIDATLERKPDLVLLDELAHSNAPGSRHPKRWHDVQELLEAGINVYTTINVQHIESLNDLVARITGVWVRETVPDAVFDSADEISLVDIPTEELLRRLQEGKVYIAHEAKTRAAQNFFKKSNLIALRELALRRTAERVDALMSSNAGTTTFSGAERLLVCVGGDPLSNRLVRVAKRMANGLKASWTAVYVENERHYRLSREGQEAVTRTMRLAERMGARTEIIQGQNRAWQDILEYAHENAITKIVVGKVVKSRWRELLSGTLADQLVRGSGDIDVYVVTGDESERKDNNLTPFWRTRAGWQNYLAAPLVVIPFTVILMPLHYLFESVTLIMVYLIGVLWVALRFGRGPAALTTLLSVVCFNFFFVYPNYSFKVLEQEHWISLLVLLITGVVVGTQTADLRQQALHSRKREKNTSSLFAMSRELSANRGKAMLSQITIQHMSETFDSDVYIWLADVKGELTTIASEMEQQDDSIDLVREESVARWTYNHKQNAGLGTDTLPSASGFYVPLLSSNGVMGVVGLVPHDEEFQAFNKDQVNLIETFATIAASALERAFSADLVEQTIVEAESEKLRNILLSSVSHDLRTPLAAITGAASTLLLENDKITPEYKTELLRSIHEEGARLARMVTNLLDVTSLESGSVKLNKELYFIEELIGSALMRVESKLDKHTVVTDIEHGLPLLRMDGLLIEQVLINLLENAAEHTGDGTRISISAMTVKPDIHVIISDNGPGITPGEEEHIFDKLYANEEGKGGLGLAICRGIIGAHGGKIWAQNNSEGGGARFTFTLPIKKTD